jgi:hypothetical protein
MLLMTGTYSFNFRPCPCISTCTLSEVVLVTRYNIGIYRVRQNGAKIRLRAHIDVKLRIVH